MAGFVVAAADDHVVVLVVAVRKAGILISFGRVVEEAVFDCSFGDLDGDAVSAHVLHLAHDAELLERDTSSHDDSIAVDGLARVGLDDDVLLVHDGRYRHGFLRHFQHPGIGLLLEPFEDGDTVQNIRWSLRRIISCIERLSLTDTWWGGMCLGRRTHQHHADPARLET